ncbi:hypothetical protein [Lacticaseibacillus rhamnosus]|uniref:hypothetical protein n=1 Tax=Lacticaseibacillus rhamnosus TaxID=47715 RepID=UPI000A771716|nr:hypothetical protein [Lacticaseibacillus rhamnosus]
MDWQHSLLSVAFFFGTLGTVNRVPSPRVGVKQGRISLADSSSSTMSNLVQLLG